MLIFYVLIDERYFKDDGCQCPTLLWFLAVTLLKEICNLVLSCELNTLASILKIHSKYA